MQPITDDPFVFAKSKLNVPKTKLPDGLKLDTEYIGKGSNNCVVQAYWKNTTVAFRMPRRKSDTQQKGSAVWEFAHTLKASQLGVSPEIYLAWYAKHANREFPSGLYFVTELFDYDLEEMIMSERNRQTVLEKADDIAKSIVDNIVTLARNGLFLYDLRPGNIVINIQDDVVTTKIIDFGRDFCEWSKTSQPDRNTPVCNLIHELVSKLPDMTDDEREQLETHIMFGTMLIQVASHTTTFIYEDRHRHRMDEETRRRVNGLARAASAFLETLQGQHKAIIRQVLRQDDVKGVLAHYHGRRNAGTRRTFRFATGCER